MKKDIHTHNKEAVDAVINLAPQEVESFVASHPGATVSTGIHPWESDQPVDYELLGHVAAMPQVLAIGECGIDKLRGASVERQEEIFKRHVALSEYLHKPLIIHCVKAWPEIMRLKKELQPTEPWIIHGFRGGAQLARQLLDHGFCLSLGEKFNAEAARIIPADRLFFETDESSLPINTIITRIRSTAH